MQDILMLQQSIVLDAPGKHCKRPTAEKTKRRESNHSMAPHVLCQSHSGLYSRVGKDQSETPIMPHHPRRTTNALVMMAVSVHGEEKLQAYLPNPSPTSHRPNANDPVLCTPDPSCQCLEAMALVYEGNAPRPLSS